MVPFTELALSRLRRGEVSLSMGRKGLSVSGGRNGGGGIEEANGDVKVFTRLFTLSRFREGEWEWSEGVPSSSEPWEGENGERTGEKNGDGNGVDIKPTKGYLGQEGGRGGRGSQRGRESLGSFVLLYLSSETSFRIST